MTLFEIAKQYRLTSPFGPRPLFNDYHWGQDFATPIGIAVHAHMDCKLILSGKYGTEWIVVMEALDGSHNWTLGHLSETYYKAGSTVKAGTLIAKTGNSGNSTGPHLHIEYDKGRFKGSVTANHNAGTTIDPMPFLAGSGEPPIEDDMNNRQWIQALNQEAWGKPASKELEDARADYLARGGSINQLIQDVFRDSPMYWSTLRVVAETYVAAGKPLDQDTHAAQAGRLQQGGSVSSLISEVMPKGSADPQTVEDAHKFNQFKNMFRGLMD